MDKSVLSGITKTKLPWQLWSGWLALTPRRSLVAGIMAVIVGAGLLVASLTELPQQFGGERLLAVLGGSSLGLLATVLGVVLVLALAKPQQSAQIWLDSALSVSGGMMLAAAIFSLLEPASVQLARVQPELQPLLRLVLLGGATLAGAGLLAWLGTWFSLRLAQTQSVTDDNSLAVCGQKHAEHREPLRLWLFVMAVALHNLPEGLAVGIGFAGPDLQLGSRVSLAIALQDLPEGFAVALVLQKLHLPRLQVLGWSLAAALPEPAGAVLASGIGQSLNHWLTLAYPLLLALAAGAMLFVVLHEVIPGVQSAGHSRASPRSSLLLLTGFLLMWMLDSEAFLLLWPTSAAS